MANASCNWALIACVIGLWNSVSNGELFMIMMQPSSFSAALPPIMAENPVVNNNTFRKALSQLVQIDHLATESV